MADEAGTTIHLDLRGLKCPLPALRTRKALRALAPGALLTVTCTDPMAAIDIPNVVREAGDELVGQQVSHQEATRQEIPQPETGRTETPHRDPKPPTLSFTIRKTVARNPHPSPH